jgi:hypothetical protein
MTNNVDDNLLTFFYNQIYINYDRLVETGDLYNVFKLESNSTRTSMKNSYPHLNNKIIDSFVISMLLTLVYIVNKSEMV